LLLTTKSKSYNLLFMNARDVSSTSMGRRPSSNPLSIQLAFRVDEKMGEALDAEIDVEQKPGLVLSRNDVARILLAEALDARAQARRNPRKR
jgi:hypothetical protein